MADRNAEAEMFRAMLTLRLEEFRKHGLASTPKKSSMASSTVIPFFDIEFNNIIAHVSDSGHKMDEVKDQNVTLKTVDQNIELLKRIFGLKKDIVSISEVRNQSTRDLGRLIG